MKLTEITESRMTCSECGGPAFSDLILAEKKDACYSKVRSRYKVWPSAYASGALVQCRKKGAANWGNKSESVTEEHDEDPEIVEMYEAMDQLVEEIAARDQVNVDLVWESFESLPDNMLYETAAWRRKEGKSKKGGLNRKGVASYRRENPGSKLQMAVTTKPSKLKKGSKAAKRRKSFCARMSGVKGPMKKPNGKPTRKALALRKWNC